VAQSPNVIPNADLFLCRQGALAILMTEAGLTIRAETLRKMSLHVLGMVIVPATGEVAAVTVLSYFILGMPWLWGVLLGFVNTTIRI